MRLIHRIRTLLGLLAASLTLAGLAACAPAPTVEQQAALPFVLITMAPNASPTPTPFQPSLDTPTPFEASPLPAHRHRLCHTHFRPWMPPPRWT